MNAIEAEVSLSTKAYIHVKDLFSKNNKKTLYNLFKNMKKIKQITTKNQQNNIVVYIISLL